MAVLFANNNSLSAITTKPSGLSGSSLNLISTQTASSSSTISFTSGIDNTYDEYMFKFIDIHPASSGPNFLFNMSIDTGSNYNVTKTSTYFRAYHYENGSSSALGHDSDGDLAQSTDFQVLCQNIGADNDQSASGSLHLFGPSNTTFVKHFISNFNRSHASDISVNDHASGYGNTTSAVDAIQFKMSSGNIDSGVIKLYGVS
jgi:hypothetical protein